jgi:hypothetical protein
MTTRTLWMGLFLVLGCNSGDKDETGDDAGDDSGDEAGTADPTESDPTVPDPTVNPTMDPTVDSNPTGNDTSSDTGDDEHCDPNGCSDYCLEARCLFEDDIDGAMCMEVCMAYCGNDFFEATDKGLLACQKQAPADLTCENAQKCCDDWLTNEICP